jgi:hypothetical protein
MVVHPLYRKRKLMSKKAAAEVPPPLNAARTAPC